MAVGIWYSVCIDSNEDQARLKAVVNIHGVLYRNGEKVDAVTDNVAVYRLRQYSY